MDNQNNTFNDQKKTYHILTLTLVGVLCWMVIIFVFSVGVFIGQERARFSSHWTENYYRNFGGSQNNFMANFPAQNLISGHGSFGQVIKIDGSQLVINGQDGMEKTIIVSDATFIRNNIRVVKLLDIRLNDTIVVIGDPDDQGQIQAKFIRILPKEISILRYIKNHETVY
jgi:hypothetical protein